MDLCVFLLIEFIVDVCRGNEVKEGKEHCRAKVQTVTSCSPGVLHGLLLGRLLGLFLHLAGWWFQAIRKFFFPSPK